MIFIKPLLKTIFIKRYKRFFTDVSFNSETLTAHCPNSGSMLGLLNPGSVAYISKADNDNRKLKYTLEIIEQDKELVGVNTHRTNKIIEEALQEKKIKKINNYYKINKEVFFNKKTRFDFLLNGKKNTFVEVKNVTLVRKNLIAEFPDAITSRGKKHIYDLIDAKKQGYECYIIFLIQRENVNFFKIAKDIDSDYHKSFLEGKKKGINYLSFSCSVSNKEIKLKKEIDIIF